MIGAFTIVLLRSCGLILLLKVQVMGFMELLSKINFLNSQDLYLHLCSCGLVFQSLQFVIFGLK